MKRPYVILNSAMSLDGKIASKSGDSQISCEEDLDRVHQIRAEVGAVMVGIGTVLADNPALTVRRVEGRNPMRIVVDSKARIPSESKVLGGSAPTTIVVSEKAKEEERKRLRSLEARVIVAGEEKVDLLSLSERLAEQGIDKILLEGGSTLNWSMLSQGLVDEVRVAVKSCVIGGEEAKSLVGGAGFEDISDCIELNLKGTERVGRDLVLSYDVKRDTSD